MGKHFWAGLTALCLVFATVSMADAQTAVFGFDDHNGSPSSGSYMPGDSFTFSITLAFVPGGNVANLEGLSYWFQQSNPGGPFIFSITNRDLSASLFNDPQTLHVIYPQNLSPQNASDLGAITDGPAQGTGAYFIADVTIQISGGAAPGIYQIENTTTGGKTSAITDDAGHTAPIPQAIYTVTIVPEPGSIALLASGIPFVAGFLRRRRATRIS
jgi:hypothetical protein